MTNSGSRDLSATVPFLVDAVDAERVIVRFAPICDHVRTKERDDVLSGLVEQYAVIACDFSENIVISSTWLRWLARLSVRSRRTGKTLALAGMNETARATADVLGLSDAFEHTRTVEEVWEL